MRTRTHLLLLSTTVALVAQAPQPSLGDRVKAERVVVEKLTASYEFAEAWKHAGALVPAEKPVFNKKDNQTLVRSCANFLDLAAAHRLALEAADTAGAWEQALDHAKAAIYARAGVPEYWILDIAARRLEVHRQPTADGIYEVVTILAETQSISPPGVDVSWRISDLLP